MTLCRDGYRLRQVLYSVCEQLTPARGTWMDCTYIAIRERESEARREAVDNLRRHCESCTTCHQIQDEIHG